VLFNSHIFLFVFLPVTLAGFCVLSRWPGPKAAKLWLTLASLFFYGWWNPIYVGLIVPSMLFNFWLGSWIGRRVRGGRSGKGPLYFGITANLLLLGYYKYANFFVANVNLLAGTDWALGKIILPLGISFFTFTQIAYLMDASRGVACEYDFWDFLLFVTFFPHLIAGPIIHHSEMMPQFAERKTYRFQWENLAIGLSIFAIGLFKKVMIADGLSGHAGKVFGAAASTGGIYPGDAWAGVLCYTFQIYFDFSGYSDMAIGLAKMFGIVLPLNFNSPYKATSISDFWRRWHMTLSRFLRDYLYIPLGGNRHGPARRYSNLIVTMLLGGFWHGAAWTFVLWGAFHGIGLAINHLWKDFFKTNFAHWHIPAWATMWSARAFTFFLVVMGWVLFRASDLAAAGHLFESMFGFGAAPVMGTPTLLKTKLWLWLALLLAGVWLLPNTAELTREQLPYPSVLKERPSPGLRWQLNSLWAGVAALLLAASVLSLSRAGEFLYYNF